VDGEEGAAGGGKDGGKSTGFDSGGVADVSGAEVSGALAGGCPNTEAPVDVVAVPALPSRIGLT
jgi:hypothetical protein